MEDNLLGYLLKALDDETHRQVEAALHASPELQARLQLLDRALTPLAADQEAPEPRPGLALATLARVAEYQCRQLPTAPPPPRQAMPVDRHWLRRSDALVAALLLIVLGGIGSSFLVHLWRDYSGQAACRNNLGLMWTGLRRYCDVHDGNFPRVEEQGARSVAGIYVPILCDSGMLDGNVSVACPAQERRPPDRRSVHELEELFAKNADAFRLEAQRLAGGYAYTLGYQDEAGYHGLRCDTADSQHQPIVADRLETPTQSNSANHDGKGQNVLYLDGHVEWRTTRNAGVKGDDIFVNWDNKVLAGKAWDDNVLGPGGASPTPHD